MDEKLKRWLYTIIIVVMSASFASCGSDDKEDEPSGSEDIAQAILGVWYWSQPNDPGAIVFLPDGMGYDEWDNERDYFNWSYDKKKDRLRIKYDADSEAIYLKAEIKGSMLVLTYEEDNEVTYWTRQNPNR